MFNFCYLFREQDIFNINNLLNYMYAILENVLKLCVHTKHVLILNKNLKEASTALGILTQIVK